MKKAISKLLFAFVAIFLVISVSVIPTLAATYVQDGDWKYEVVGNHSEYYIESYLGSSGRVSIPALFQQKPVTAVNSEAFLNNTVVQYVEFPATVTSIGMNAFYGCTSLKSVTIPSEITSIGNNAFYGCTSLVLVTFESDSALGFVPRNCFSGCTSLTTVVLTQGVESIDALAFNGCTALTTAIIPPSVTSIAEYAFKDCDKLVINGWEDTFAQQYAEDNGISFISYGTYVEPTEPATTVPVTTVPFTTEVTDPTETSTADFSTVVTETSEPTVNTEDTNNTDITDNTVTTTEVVSTDPPETETATQAPTKKYLIGDADLSGVVTVKDATLIQKYSADLAELDRVQLFLANCNGAGDVNVKDATQIQKYCADFLNILFVGTEVEI